MLNLLRQKRALCLTLLLSGLGVPSANALIANDPTPISRRAQDFNLPLDQQYWKTHVQPGRISLGNGAYVSPAHIQLPGNAMNVIYLKSCLSAMRADLVVYTLSGEAHPQPNLPIKKELPQVGEELMVFCQGKMGIINFKTLTSVYASGCLTSALELAPLSPRTQELASTPKAQIESGDSGGGVFSFDPKTREWNLVGIVLASLTNTKGTKLPPGSIFYAANFTQVEGFWRYLEDYRNRRPLPRNIIAEPPVKSSTWFRDSSIVLALSLAVAFGGVGYGLWLHRERLFFASPDRK